MFTSGIGTQLMFRDSWGCCQILFAVYLVVLSVMDIRWKKIHLLFLLAGFLFVPAGSLCGRNTSWILFAAGGAAGLLFLLLSRITRESLGYGDSILILTAGCFIGFWNLMYMLVAAFSMSAIFSVIMMSAGKFSRKSSFPFVPFLTAAYIGGMLIAGY